MPEAAAVVGLPAGLGIAAFGVAAAAGLVAVMVGAVGFRIRVHDAIPWLLGDAAVLLLAAVTAILRCDGVTRAAFARTITGLDRCGVGSHLREPPCKPSEPLLGIPEQSLGSSGA